MNTSRVIGMLTERDRWPLLRSLHMKGTVVDMIEARQLCTCEWPTLDSLSFSTFRRQSQKRVSNVLRARWPGLRKVQIENPRPDSNMLHITLSSV